MHLIGSSSDQSHGRPPENDCAREAWCRRRALRQCSRTWIVPHAYKATATKSAVRTSDACITLLPVALSSIAGPNRINAVMSALLQKEGGYADLRAPNSRAPVHSAARIIHSISIHRLGSSERPIHNTAAISAPMNVEPTSSRPASLALVSSAC